MAIIVVKTIGLKLWSSKGTRTRPNQVITDYFTFRHFEHHYDAHLYFKDYYFKKYGYTGSIKIKIRE